MIFLLGLVCVCVSARASALQEAISGFKYAGLLTCSCIYCLKALAPMDLAMGHVYIECYCQSVSMGVPERVCV